MNKTITSLLICALLATGGCATTRHTDAQESNKVEQQDPLEGFNRKVYRFNEVVDGAVLRPVAKAYADHVPLPVKTGLGNFLSNLGEPANAINNLLQAKFEHSLDSIGRFGINTTFGLLGLIDIATMGGLPKQAEDFGQTLAIWGVPRGPYLVLPFFGPSSLRAASGRLVDSSYLELSRQFNSHEKIGNLTLGAITGRAKYLGIDQALALQLDPYAFIRANYVRQRENSISDGQSAAQETIDEELLEDALFD